MTAIERAPHVLRVDDEISIVTFAKRALSERATKSLSRRTAHQALRIVEAHGPFDLFVIDVMMPQMRGDALGCQLR